ncbi:hypothetical protein A4X06_0g9865, partial [Tilletia controversa]
MPVSETDAAVSVSLRFLDRLPEDERAAIEEAIYAQLDADVEAEQVEAARKAEEDAERLQQEAREAEEENERQAQALREQEAHLLAAKNLVDLAKAQTQTLDTKEKSKKVVQDDNMENMLDLLVAVPSQKIRDKIRNNDFIDLWHLTAEGMAVATKSKLTGDTSFTLGADGTFEMKDSTVGFKPDQDLSMASWVTALGNYVRVMQAEGVAENIVHSLVRLNHTLINHPLFEQHGAAIRLWHRRHRYQWTWSGSLNASGMRFNLGKPNPAQFDELRLGLLEQRAERRVTASTKRPHFDDTSSTSSTPGIPRAKIARSNFRCFVCFSSEGGHPFRTCAAKERVDGKEQLVVRGPTGRIVFADSQKPICLDFQLK